MARNKKFSDVSRKDHTTVQVYFSSDDLDLLEKLDIIMERESYNSQSGLLRTMIEWGTIKYFLEEGLE